MKKIIFLRFLEIQIVIFGFSDYEVLWHGGSYFGIESALFWIPTLNMSVFINVNARLNLGFPKYQQVVQQIPLILLDLLMDNFTRVTPDNICELFNFPSTPKYNNQLNESFETPYNFDKGISSIINGKYIHPAFGEVLIRNYREKDREWILNPYETSLNIVFEYGKLLKALLIRTDPQCKIGKYFGKDTIDNSSKISKYYGFYMYKGQPYWFITPIIVPVVNSNLSTNNDICQVIIQHNLLSNELRLQTRLLDNEIIEFVRSNGVSTNIYHSVLISVVGSYIFLRCIYYC